MVKRIVAVGVIVAWASVAGAGTPPTIEKFLKDQSHIYSHDGGEWKYATSPWKPDHEEHGCQTLLDAAKKDGVASTLVVDVPFDTPDWKAGKHSIADLQAYCDHQKKSSAVSLLAGYLSGVGTDADDAVRCIDNWDYSVTEGVTKLVDPDKIQLPYEGIGSFLVDKATGNPFKGTLNEARKKYCDAYAKEALEARAKEEGPYRKVLKAGKLQVYLEQKNRRLYGAGKKEMTTAAQMAQSNVWFRLSSYEDQGCNGGSDHKYFVRRWQFDAKQEVAKDTGKDFCGEPPASAYK